ncbi:hypothetical protein PR202_ga04336 [Eleusine coracana subsp. coracana]|uniref:Uncharacterized protein n=1 Tax=Eleusine coracana subsp. coracana TaxID=191504 RepID=A0AAV5BPC9_ELECO|nr:hypothetical protein PR202_ga04336 [Eleusine coracana subsp. coracana]
METKSSPGSQLKPVDQEAQEKAGRKRGGWITLPFIAGSMIGLGLGVHGTSCNLLVYLLKEYNVDSIEAVKISSNVFASLYLVPVAGAIASDSYFGCFPVMVVGTAINILAFILFILSAALPSLRPPRCAVPSAACQHATSGQLAVLYSAVSLLAIGTGGTRFNIATMGADQFSSVQEQDSFFNWYFVFLCSSFLIGNTAIVYLEDSVSWAVGFSVCLAATVVSLVILLLGARYFHMPVPKGSPYTELARVFVAAVRKARVNISGLERVQYYVGDGTVIADADSDGAPSKRLRQQVEDLKSLLGTLPIWSAGILLSLTVGVLLFMAVLQALAMDRSLGPRFKVPAGSISVASLAAFAVVTLVVDRTVFPLWRRVTGALPTPLQRVGLGHVLNVAAMVSAALVERRRLRIVREHHGDGSEALGWVAPMSVMWLVFPLGLAGAGEAVHFPGNMAFYYQEFPATLRTLATAMAPLLSALGFFLTTPFVDMVKRETSWLPLNINEGRLDNVFWILAAVAAANFGYLLVCVSLYKGTKPDEGKNAHGVEAEGTL